MEKSNCAKLNEFDSVDKFINAFEHDKLRL